MDVAKGQNHDDNDQNMKLEDEVVLPGFRFHPTDEELVGFYLRRKVENKPLRIELIKHVDIYKYDPWDLPKVSSVGEKEWYFFCMRGRKYRNSIRPNRVTKSGFWKATGIDKPIYGAKEAHQCIGLKKSLVYYRGSAGKGTKTDWMMHEFRLPPNLGKICGNVSNHPDAHAGKDVVQEAEVWTLCRIFKRIPSYKKYTPSLKAVTRTFQTDSLSSNKSCSLESDNNNCKPYLTFTDSDVSIQQQISERKPVIINGHHHFVVDERNNGNDLFEAQAPTTTTTSNLSYSTSCWNQNVDDLFLNENWDDLRSVIQLATDPSSKVL